MYSDKKTVVFFGKKPKKPKPQPASKPPPPIPVQDVAVTDTTSKKAEALRRQRGGVASTVMSDTLGG